MKIAFLIDPLASLKPYKDSSVAMMRAAQKRGHQLFVIEPGALHARGAIVSALATEIKVSDDNAAWVTTIESKARPLTDFDTVIERKDPPFDMEYVYRTYLLERAETQGVKVWNRPSAIRDHNEKASILGHADMIAPTLVARDPALLRAFHNEHGDVIYKPLDGMGGMGIFRAKPGEHNLSVILETLTRNGAETIMAQRYLPEIADGDKRILLIAGEVVPFALARIPATGETRGNMAAGGRPEARELSTSDRAIATEMAKRLWTKGLLLVGLDVIGDKVTEINVTSPTGFVEIEKQTGFDAAGFFVQRLEKYAH